MNKESIKEFTIDCFLSAAECNAQQEMSLPLLVQRLIDVSTAHANATGIGYDRLLQFNSTWVLSRLTVEMERLPSVNENYSLTTWIETLNRHFSERNVEIRDNRGKAIGYARLVWVAIDIDSRRPADLSPLLDSVETSAKDCPIARQTRLTPIGDPDDISMYRFRFSDIDFNRHVNSTRYIQLILDCLSLEFFDKRRVAGFEIAYHNEACYGDIAEVRRKGDENAQEFEIVRDDTVCTRARVRFSPRKVVN